MALKLETSFVRMAAADIWTDADTKNRQLTEITAALDAAQITLHIPKIDDATAMEYISVHAAKPFADASDVTDSSVLMSTKGLSEDIALSELFYIGLGRAMGDQSAVLDSASWTFSTPFADSFSPVDIPLLDFTHGQADAVTTVENLTRDYLAAKTDTFVAVEVQKITHYQGEIRLSNRPQFNQILFG